MIQSESGRAMWRKSSYSEQGTSECVEVARVARVVGVRDSKNPGGPVLSFNRAEWNGLLAKVKSDGL